MTIRRSTIAALGSAAFLAACGNHQSAAAAPAPEARKPTSARPTPPARPPEAPYFMPDEWRAQLRSRALVANPAYLQALAIYLYQNQNVPVQDGSMPWVTALFSCDDAMKSFGNEIERPAAYERARSKLQAFFARPPALGHVDVTTALGPYDTTAQSFGWAAPGDASGSQPGRGSYTMPEVQVLQTRISCAPSRTLTGAAANGMNFSALLDGADMAIQGAVLPPVSMPTAKASAFLQKHGAVRTVAIEVDFTVPARSGGLVNAPGMRRGGVVRLPVTYAGAKITEANDPGAVLATFRP